MEKIKAARQRQADGIDRIGCAIVSMDVMTQRNFTLVEEASDAAGSLFNETAQLASALEMFKLDSDGVTTTAHGRLLLPSLEVG